MSPTIWIVTGAVVLLLVGLDWFAGRIVRPDPKPVDRTVPELGFTHEDLRIESGDHELAAWLIQPPEAQPFEPLVLVAHGWSANYSTVLALAEPLAETGHEVLLFDVRGHGRNDPQPYVSVRAFRDDLIAVTRYAATRFPDRQLVVIGHSMGDPRESWPQQKALRSTASSSWPPLRTCSRSPPSSWSIRDYRVTSS